jgi:hypothetical protein
MAKRKPPEGNLRVLSSVDYAQIASDSGDEESAAMLRTITRRKDSVREEQSRFSGLADRFDNLYYANELTKGGADHWPDDPNMKIVGKVHVSVNVYPTYVDVPAALQAVPPIENIVPPMGEDTLQDVASMVERMYFAWKEQVQFETKSHKMATIKSLYGKGAAKVIWDEESGHPDFVLVEQPRNLWLGWRGNDYSQLEWAVYSYFISPEEAIEKYGLDIALATDGETGGSYIYVRNYSEWNPDTLSHRSWLTGSEHGMLEVNDYWYRRPKGTPVKGQRTEMETCNVITVGNCIVEETPREEYAGRMPYVPVFNTYIPGLPEGRSDLYDVEQVLREKDERISAGGTMVTKLVGKQFWQLVGPEAPDRVPSGLRPEPDRVVAPGPGNRIEAITPWMPEFQLEAYLARLDRELQDISGLNDLLRGLAPAQVLSSSKAINALVANYEARITLRRRLFYQWRMDIWDLVKTVWGQKNENLAAIFLMAGRLVVKPPSLTPRDDIEQATMALNLLNGKVWALERAQDATGVEDPQREQQTIERERKNPAIFPQDVQAQAALLATMQQLQMQAAQMQQMQGPPQAPPGDAEAQAMAAQEARRGAADQATPGGSPMMNGEGEQGVPPEGASAFQGGPGYNAVNQTMLQNGEPSNRILLQQPLGPEGGQ